MKELAWVVLSVILASALSYVFAVGIVSIGKKQIDFIINRRKAKQLAKRKEITQTVLPLANVVRGLLLTLEEKDAKDTGGDIPYTLYRSQLMEYTDAIFKIMDNLEKEN